MIRKPMLAGKAPEDLSEIKFPVMASPKLDGIRALVVNGQLVSRKLKLIPNDYIRECLRGLPEGLDGELLLRDWTAPFNKVTSAVMSKEGEPDFVYAVFDFEGQAFFYDRFERLTTMDFTKFVDLVPHTRVTILKELLVLHRSHLRAGFEGTMVRDPRGPYKQGRSTTKEGYLLKIKEFADEEAIVVGFEELMENTNEAKKDALGHTERSTAKGGMVGKNTLGALVMKFEDGTQFTCGSGLTDEVRADIWSRPNDFKGRRAKIKHQPAPGGRGAGEAPRFPVFLGWRSELD